MLIAKSNPVGIDVAIGKFQSMLHTALMGKWGLDTEDPAQNALYECYGRVYRNKTANGYVAEAYTGNGEYKSVSWNDGLHALSFFGVGTEESKEAIGVKSQVHLVFFVNLAKLKPSIAHRADEETRLDVLELLMPVLRYGFTFTGLETSVERAMKEYPASYKGSTATVVDTHPVHCFRLNFELKHDKFMTNCP